ncbi:DUF4058 family protein [Spirulina sp. CS-785/01]|uniref:DUF4058 family protein n=1 Tax=Spirulina sp. CS-785/01 TaxID=3021716 RepID=UPI0023314034|nr:DUF4058 family protein [Spirulina sp. CS-785/01]MDB9315359.1 DUF4058 family protein [Spirulina sp. CS-785/01]
MPSPFPGMDPYLEQPDFWPEIHNRLITLIADTLIPQVRPKYRVAIEKRIYELNAPQNGDNSLLVGIPDVSVNRQTTSSPLNVAVAAPPTQPLTVQLPLPERIKQTYLEIRNLSTQEVVTAIEILSPVNKRTGEGRDTYLTKRQKILGSSTNLIEIDLLRQGEPMPMINPPSLTHYRVLVSDFTQRPKADLYAFNVQQSLPQFTVPLRSEDPWPTLDLQAILNQVYDRGGYDYVVDYQPDPIPPLSATDTAWMREVLDSQQG